MICFLFGVKFGFPNKTAYVFNNCIRFSDNIVGIVEQDDDYQIASFHLSTWLLDSFDLSVDGDDVITYGLADYTTAFNGTSSMLNNCNFIIIYIVYLFYALFWYCIIKLLFALPDWLFHKLNYFIYGGCKK